MIPVVLHHGLFGYGQLKLGSIQVSYFHKIDRAILGKGYPLIIPQVHPTASIETRARQLKQVILDRLEGMGKTADPVIIIAHSMGGLDARYMISKLGMADRVAALLTITTPHRGSPYADWIVKHLDDRLGLLRLVNQMGLDVSAARDLTTASCLRFNEEIIDSPRVKYFSISCQASRLPPFAWHSHKVISSVEGSNDGLVSPISSNWGTRIETWDVDHWQAINKPIPLCKPSPCDVIGKYLQALDYVGKVLS